MLASRTGTVLRSIVRQYITKATPVSSHSIIDDYDLGVSAATIRNEMAHLEQESYITRPHPSAGGIPSDKGYRYYVETLGDIQLPLAEQRLVNHLFHQVEKELEEWLNLAARLIAQLVQDVAIVTMPKSVACQFKYLELVALQDSLALLVLILRSTKAKQQLITFTQCISQSELTAIANKLNALYSGLTSSQIIAKGTRLFPTEQQITDCLSGIMKAEDKQEYEEPYLDGLRLMLNQPEFTHSYRMLSLLELVEHGNLLRNIIPPGLTNHGVQVIIGKENKAEVIHDYSVVISQYGLPEEAIGTIGVIGPTRMPYARAISTVDHLSSVLSRLVSELYGKETPTTPTLDNTD